MVDGLTPVLVVGVIVTALCGWGLHVLRNFRPTGARRLCLPAACAPPIDKLIRSAVALDDAFKCGGRLWTVIAYDWRITAPRSRRGRKTALDANIVERLMSEGRTAKEIATMYGVHEKTPYNIRNKARKRRI